MIEDEVARNVAYARIKMNLRKMLEKISETCDAKAAVICFKNPIDDSDSYFYGHPSVREVVDMYKALHAEGEPLQAEAQDPVAKLRHLIQYSPIPTDKDPSELEALKNQIYSFIAKVQAQTNIIQ